MLPLYVLTFASTILCALASPSPSRIVARNTDNVVARGEVVPNFEWDLVKRTDPVFPSEPPSCPKCQQDYPVINSCAQAAPVLANFSMVIFNPGAFIDVIKCACVDTFQAAFPQCVDCFVQTGQDQVLNTPDLPSVVDGMRKVCAIQSTLFGNVSDENAANPSPTPNAASVDRVSHQLALALGSVGVAIVLSSMLLV